MHQIRLGQQPALSGRPSEVSTGLVSFAKVYGSANAARFRFLAATLSG